MSPLMIGLPTILDILLALSHAFRLENRHGSTGLPQTVLNQNFVGNLLCDRYTIVDKQQSILVSKNIYLQTITIIILIFILVNNILKYFLTKI
ncbi:Uncharacterised protein [Moraxella lacunata]|uniref:Uncharacterized protein n=1 Tax=Moraxella lacunata TaxID=477 RepID=A0A378TTG9_MORLA|nr:Uncharacterised protein [Moraxella lacunata]